MLENISEKNLIIINILKNFLLFFIFYLFYDINLLDDQPNSIFLIQYINNIRILI